MRKHCGSRLSEGKNELKAENKRADRKIRYSS